MFYSRPPIEPLRWDLVGLPTPNGSRNFDALTADGRPIDFRFSSGWLTVERGEVGAQRDDCAMEEVLSLPISPFGTMDIEAEQICDILGLSVNGHAVVPTGNRLDRGFDWSGRTTYWHSSHLMTYQGDAEALIRKVADAFPGSVMVQPTWQGGALKVRSRRITILSESDRVVTIGISFETARLDKMLIADDVPTTEFEGVFAHRIDVIRADHDEDLTGKTDIESRGARPLHLDYEVLRHRRYRIQMEYRTDDAQAHSIMQGLLAIIDEHFCRNFLVVNLETGVIIAEDTTDEEDTRSYSRHLRDWCLAKSNRYVSVGLLGAPPYPVDSTPTFVGFRPMVRR